MVDAGAVVDLLKDARERRTAPLILELDLTDGLVEGPPADPVSAVISMRRAHLRDVLDGLRKGRSDPRVRALLVRIGGNRLGLAVAQELRTAVQAFRDAGKLTVAWAESFGETGRGTVPYYLATAFERIYLQPSGDLALTGVALEEPFFNEALEKAGITPRFAKRHEYKTAANTFTERSYTAEHREMSDRIVSSIGEQLIAGVAAGRGLPEDRVRELIDRAPLLGPEALEAGLVDRLAYRDEVYAEVRAAAGGPGAEARLRYVARYNRAQGVSKRIPRPQQDVVALIQGHGPIRLGRSGRSLLPGQSASIGSDTVAAAFRAAVGDDKVKAIVFRIDSPGGSYVASDTIWREVILARKAGKPVIVSMGNVAASGGYFVAAPADVIVAQPGTLTGSIGVVIGKPVVGDLLDRLGIGLGSVEHGAHARMYAPTRDFTDEEWSRVNTFLDRVYDDFVGKVAEGRGLSPERVHELARGRVWTGADAHERGLVDRLGGLAHAVDLARKKAGLATDAPIRTYPRVSTLDRLRPAESSDDRTAASARVDAWGPLTGVAARLGLPSGGPLMLPGAWEIR
ncbi:signal peptide peptidase SppA [Actinoallomurus soli]|uniref:signal peptide peptidase SppA n=1 Tax=Actinoallomurus soli TaxID=2952535 RepID=UPI00209271E1|nr:signal peptide peptidase SppA [Actinoallomurus soli]MCO5970841.1 signal peptide peptidase SppA [Actinoallomurus soli]